MSKTYGHFWIVHTCTMLNCAHTQAHTGTNLSNSSCRSDPHTIVKKAIKSNRCTLTYIFLPFLTPHSENDINAVLALEPHRHIGAFV